VFYRWIFFVDFFTFLLSALATLVEFWCGLIDAVSSDAPSVNAYPGWLVFLKDFQTLIGGTLAFAGVILVVLFSNRGLSRQLRDAAESEITRVENERILDEQRLKLDLGAKRSAIEGALFAEIVTISDFLKTEQNQARNYLNPDWKFVSIDEPEAENNINPEEDLDLPEPTVPYRFSIPDRDIVYRGLVKKIGALEHDSIKLVIKAYDHFYSFRSWLSEHDCSQQKSSNMVEIKPEEVNKLISAIQDTIGEMNSVFAQYSSTQNQTAPIKSNSSEQN